MPTIAKHHSQEKARIIRNEQRKKNYSKTAKYKKRAWTEDEEKAVLEQKITDAELSIEIKRSVQSIQNKRSRLKKSAKEESEEVEG